jgi:hypothetical protein
MPGPDATKAIPLIGDARMRRSSSVCKWARSNFIESKPSFNDEFLMETHGKE